MDWLKTILEAKGIEGAEDIIADVQKELPKHFIPKNVYAQKVKDYDSLKAEYDAKPDAGEIQTKLDALQAKYDTDTAELNKKLSDGERSHAIDMALSKSGAKSEKALRALLDDSKIEFKDGRLTGLDEQLTEVKKEHSYLFGAAKDTGLGLGGGGGDGGDKFIAAMRQGAGLKE